MELSWLTKIRITLALALGAGLIGFLASPLTAPAEPLEIITAPPLSNLLPLMLLSFAAALIAYFLCYPYGPQIAVLTVPTGLAILAARTATVASQLQQQNPEPALRQQFYASLRWDAVYWFAVLISGFAAIILARLIALQNQKPSTDTLDDSTIKNDSAGKFRLALTDVFLPQATLPKSHQQPKPQQQKENKSKDDPKSNPYLNIIIALLGSCLIAQLCITIFAQAVKAFDNRLATVIAQPGTGQIIFAVLVSFGIAAFIIKLFLNESYIWPAIASVILTIYTYSTYAKPATMAHLVKNWPPVFFANVSAAILPIQMVALGTLGAIVGYWVAVRYDYWRKHELK